VFANDLPRIRVRQIKQEGATLHLELSGKRAIAYFRFQRIEADEKFTHFEYKPKYEEVELLANRYIQGYISGRYDRVEVVYMKFLNAARQTPVVETLLPLSSVEAATQVSIRKRSTGEEVKTSPVEYEFLPNAQDILEELLPVSFKASASCPTAVLLLPVVFLKSAALPLAALALPVVLRKSAEDPIAVLDSPIVLNPSADHPIAVLLLPVVLSWSA